MGEAMDLLGGSLTQAAAEARTSLRTRQLAKRQRTWFRNRVEAARRRGSTPPRWMAERCSPPRSTPFAPRRAYRE